MRNIRVMIVEDDPMISFLHKAILQKKEIEQDPLTFMNGKEAWDFLVNDSPDKYYLVLLDLNMPVLNGWQFLDKLEDQEHIASRTKVAIVTSSMNPADKERAKNYSMVEHYLSKPLLQFSEINKMIDRLKKIQGNPNKESQY